MSRITLPDDISIADLFLVLDTVRMTHLVGWMQTPALCLNSRVGVEAVHPKIFEAICHSRGHCRSCPFYSENSGALFDMIDIYNYQKEVASEQ
jgi:hypothetical protein